MTGTPIGKGSVDDLFGLLVFLKVSLRMRRKTPPSMDMRGG